MVPFGLDEHRQQEETEANNASESEDFHRFWNTKAEQSSTKSMRCRN
jgi:hypothetical protein